MIIDSNFYINNTLMFNHLIFLVSGKKVTYILSFTSNFKPNVFQLKLAFSE